MIYPNLKSGISENSFLLVDLVIVGDCLAVRLIAFEDTVWRDLLNVITGLLPPDSEEIIFPLWFKSHMKQL